MLWRNYCCLSLIDDCVFITSSSAGRRRDGKQSFFVKLEYYRESRCYKSGLNFDWWSGPAYILKIDKTRRIWQRSSACMLKPDCNSWPISRIVCPVVQAVGLCLTSRQVYTKAGRSLNDPISFLITRVSCILSTHNIAIVWNGAFVSLLYVCTFECTLYQCMHARMRVHYQSFASIYLWVIQYTSLHCACLYAHMSRPIFIQLCVHVCL